MGKVIGSYASVVRGVSEQVPTDRLPGQMGEQVNMVSDPVRGLARRHGSVTMDENLILGSGANLTADQINYARNYRTYDFFVGGTEYTLLYQSDDRAPGDTLPLLIAQNKLTGQYLNVVLNDSVAGALDPWRNGGISAVTLVGRFIILASNALGPGYSTVDNFAASSGKAVGWVRGGAYSRTYTVTIKTVSNGLTYTGSFTTMASSYPNLLDTSDIAQSDPEYQKKVNDRVNAYNSAVNKWIGDALASQQPANIAVQLVASIVAAGFPGGFSAIAADNGSILTQDCANMSVSDAGDGSLFRAVHLEVDDPVKLSTRHYANKVVRVKPKGTDEAYYMKAVVDNPALTFGTVTWVETAGVTVTPGQVFAIGRLTNDGTTLHVADTPAKLAAVLGEAVPGYSASVSGDLSDKLAVPYFFGKRVTNLFVFQDRLGIIANGVTFMSRTGDYFNWFRKSKLRVDKDDPIEAFALGSEDDVITQSITYNKDLFLYGERNQYAVPGRAAVTPDTIAITAVAGEKDAMLARPLPVGNLLFYGKYESALDQTGPSPYAASLHQFQLGLFQDTPETYTASQQLDKYLRGQIIELASLPKPYTVFCRTNGLDNGLYTYRFIDQQGTQARQLDSWSRWEWSPIVGRIIGITTYKSTLFVHVLRENEEGVWVACEQFVMDSATSTRPYLDAMRNGAMYEAGSVTTNFMMNLSTTQKESVSVAGIKTYPSYLLGGNIVNYATLKANTFAGDNMRAMVGVNYDAYFEPTQPYMRDRNDNAIDNGRLTVNRKTVALVETGGMDADLTTITGTVTVFRFNGRRVGLSNNQVGMQPYTTASVNVPVGRNNTEYTLRLKSRTWLPMCVSNIEWVGQFFLNSRRV